MVSDLRMKSTFFRYSQATWASQLCNGQKRNPRPSFGSTKTRFVSVLALPAVLWDWSRWTWISSSFLPYTLALRCRKLPLPLSWRLVKRLLVVQIYFRGTCVYLQLTKVNSEEHHRMPFRAEAFLTIICLKKDLSVLWICHLSSSVTKQTRNFWLVSEHVSFLKICMSFFFSVFLFGKREEFQGERGEKRKRAKNSFRPSWNFPS